MGGTDGPRADNFLQPSGTRAGLCNPAPLSTVPEKFRAGACDRPPVQTLGRS